MVVVGTGVVQDGTLRTAHQAVLGPVGPALVAALGSHLCSAGKELAPELARVRLTATM